MKWNILLLGMSDDNTLNNILNTLVTCYWELPWANTLNNVNRAACVIWNVIGPTL